MASTKKTPEEIKELVTSSKEELKIASKEYKTFCKENKIEMSADEEGKDTTPAPEDEKKAKKFKKLQDQVAKKQKAYDEAKGALTEVKEKKSAAPRDFKYAYPVGASADDKKKIRAKARAAAKAAEKAAAKGETAAGEKEKKSEKKKSDVKKKTEEAPAAEKGEKKKSDKKKSAPKEEAAATTED